MFQHHPCLPSCRPQTAYSQTSVLGQPQVLLSWQRTQHMRLHVTSAMFIKQQTNQLVGLWCCLVLFLTRSQHAAPHPGQLQAINTYCSQSTRQVPHQRVSCLANPAI
jgi:hypothetical protein